jgi:PAS domain S-box-containing protein
MARSGEDDGRNDGGERKADDASRPRAAPVSPTLSAALGRELVALAETLGDGMIAADADGRLLTMNPAAERITGWQLLEAVGRDAGELLGGSREDGPSAASALEQAAQSRGGPLRLEPGTLLRTREGREQEISGGAVAVNAADPARRLVVMVFREVSSAQRQLEQQVYSAQRMEAVGRFAGAIAHDFNNLLGAILGYCDIIGEELPPDAPVQTDLAEIVSAAERGVELTSQLVAFSRQQSVEPRVVDLNEVVASMQRMFARLLGRGVELRTRLEAEAGLVKADRSRLEQVLMNLVVNADDAMPEGGELRIETGTVELSENVVPPLRPGRYAVLSVVDSGVGMNDEVRSRAFEPFFTTKDGGAGTGLGLSTVYGIVAQSRGAVTVDSEPDAGTRISIFLPQVAAEPEPAASPVEPATGLDEPGGETVLVAEDEEALRHLMARTLRRCGYTVLEARDGADALRVAGEHDGTIHLLVTDVVMPLVTGPQLAQRLQEERGPLPVLYVSGHQDEQLVPPEIFDRPGRFLRKPFVGQQLATTIRALLDEAAAG